jgi:hypothetical protein
MKAHSEFGPRRGLVAFTTLCSRERDQIPIVQEARWGTGPAVTDALFSPPPPPLIRIRSPDRPLSSKSIYRLNYFGQRLNMYVTDSQKVSIYV